MSQAVEGIFQAITKSLQSAEHLRTIWILFWHVLNAEDSDYDSEYDSEDERWYGAGAGAAGERITRGMTREQRQAARAGMREEAQRKGACADIGPF